MVPGAEPAPPPPPPRAVSLWSCLALGKAKAISFLAFLLLGTALGVLFTWLGGGLPPGPDAALDARHALVKTGRLVRQPYLSKTRVGNRRALVLEFAFTLPSGKEVKGVSYTFSAERIQSILRNPKALPIEYDPEDPERARIAGTRANYLPSWLFLLPGAFLATALILGAWWIVSSLRIHELAVHGRALPAVLEEIRPVVGVNPPPWRLTWTLKDPPPGVPPTGTALIPRSHPAARTFRKGETFWVVADEFSGRAYPWIFREKTLTADLEPGGPSWGGSS